MEPIDAARWMGREPCVSFIRSGAIDLASKDLEDWGKISLRGTVGMEIHESDFYLPRSVYLSVSNKGREYRAVAPLRF